MYYLGAKILIISKQQYFFRQKFQFSTQKTKKKGIEEQKQLFNAT